MARMNLMNRAFAALAVRRRAPPAQPASDAAQLSRDHFSDAMLGHLMRADEVDETLRLAGIARHQLRRLQGDDEIGAALQTRRAAVAVTPWRIEGYDESAPMQHLDAMLRRHVDALMEAAWDAVPMGFSVCEAVWGPGEGAAVDLVRVARVPLQYFNPRADGALLGSLPGVGYEQLLDSEFKFFHTVREQSYEAPHGMALLAPLYWPWHFRSHGWRYWMQFMERFGMPIVVGRVFDPQAFVQSMAGLGINTAIAVDKDAEVNVVSQGFAGEFERLDAALNKRIQKYILGQTLTSDVGKTGSYAAASVHDLVRADRKAADLRLVRATVQRVVNAFWRLNRYGGPVPEFCMEDGKGIEAERAERDERLANAGIARFTEQYLLTHYDFEPGDIELPAAPADAPAAPPGAPAGVPAGAPAQAAARGLRLGAAGRARQFTPGQQALEDLADLAASRAGDVVPLAAIRTALQGARDPQELAERLAALLADAPASTYTEALRQALFAADVLGWANAQARRY